MTMPKPVHMPWAQPLPKFRERQEGESTKDWFEAKCLFMHNACLQARAEHLLAHPEDLRR